MPGEFKRRRILMESLSGAPLPLPSGEGDLPGPKTGEVERRGILFGKHHYLPHGLGEPASASASKEWPHPQEEVAFGFWNTKPEPLRSFT